MIWRHGVRAAITPMMTVFGIDLGVLLGGAVITERIFEIHGVGLLNITAISQSDFPIVQGTTRAGRDVRRAGQHRRRRAVRLRGPQSSDPVVMAHTRPDTPLLQVEGLQVSFNTDDGVVHAVDGASYSVASGAYAGDRR